MQLPRALAPWSAYLNLFAYPVNTQLGAMVERIDRIIGTYDSFTAHEQGEIEGYDGIDRRGDYERLVLTEWLLADELPDEFLRRAASNEHTFLQPARAQPCERRLTTVLLDAGPAQLGAPRLAHIALLIVLARRADSFGSRFEWGVLQEPTYLMDGLTESGIERLLRSRALQAVTSQNAEDWSSILEPAKSEIWIIGPEDLKMPDIEKLSRASLTESFGPHERNLRLCVEAAGRRPRQVNLPLPDEDIGARVLRHPFAKQHNTIQAGSMGATSNVMFSASGRHIIVRTSKHTIGIFRTPTIHNTELKPKLYSATGKKPIIAAGSGGMQAAAILLTKVDKHLLEIEFIGGIRANLRAQVEVPFPIADIEHDSPIFPCIALRADSNETVDTIAVVDEKMIRFSPIANWFPNRLSEAEVEETDVTFVSQIADSVIYGTKQTAAICWSPPAKDNLIKKLPFRFNAIRFGYGGQNAYQNLGLLAVQKMDGEWFIEPFRRHLPPVFSGNPVSCGVMFGARVLGVVGVQKDVALIAVDNAAPNAPYIVGADWNMKLPVCEGEIRNADVNPAGNIVYISSLGELVVFSPERAISGNGCLFRTVLENPE